MFVNDPVADLCTRVRNAMLRQHTTVSIPYSNIKKGVCNVLSEEGFIEKWELDESTKFPMITVHLKYNDRGESVIRKIQRISKPGRRVYCKVKDIKPVLNGQGISILTTSKGVLSDRQCHEGKLGGEILCQLW